MQEKELKPKLRFKEFADSWKGLPLNQIAELRKGKYNPTVDKDNLIDIELESIESNTGRLITTFESKKLKSIKNIFYRGDVLYGKLRPYLHKYYRPNFNGVCSTEIWVLKNTDLSENEYIYYLVQSQRFKLSVNIQFGSKMPRADWSIASNANYIIPSIKEQQKIASFLSTVDSYIENLKRQKESLEKYKKGMMQKIFSQQIRFKDVSGKEFPKWEEKKLGEVATFRRGSFPQPYGLPEWYDDVNGEPFVQVFDVDSNMRLKPETKQKISEAAKPSSVFVEKGTVIITIQGSIGRVALTQYNCYIDRTLLIFQSFKLPIDKIFFTYILELLFDIEKGKAPGGTIKTITKEVLTSFRVKIPSLSEQKKISNLLSSIVNGIDSKQKQIGEAELWKKGLLQQLFI